MGKRLQQLRNYVQQSPLGKPPKDTFFFVAPMGPIASIMSFGSKLAESGMDLNHAKHSAVCACDIAKKACAPIETAARQGNWRQISSNLDNKSDLVALSRLQTGNIDPVTTALLKQYLTNQLGEV